MDRPLVEAVNLCKYFKTPKGQLHAVEDVNFKIYEGRTLGVVGESGCGKSTLGRTVLRLHQATSGQVLYEGDDILKYSKRDMHKVQRNMQMIFQDPYSSLDPRMSIRALISEPLEILNRKNELSATQLKERVDHIMDMCGLPSHYSNLYPHELDGGMRQRVGLARSMILNPKFIVCDEPVSALDVSIQAQVVNMFEDLQEKLGVAYLFIAHDLLVVHHISKRIAVMYLGKIVEIADSDEINEHPLHPYTQSLISAVPIPDPDITRNRHRIVLEGDVPSPLNMPQGCPFRTRCRYACDKCAQSMPPLTERAPGHKVACHVM